MLRVTTKDTTKDLKRMPKLLEAVEYRIVAEAAEQFAQLVKSKYLSGQRLRVRTGFTRRSVAYYQYRKNRKDTVYAVRPGHNVRGRLNYLYKLERKPSRAFMGPAQREFAKSGKMQKIASETLKAMTGIG